MTTSAYTISIAKFHHEHGRYPYLGGDHQVCSMVRVPSPEAEDAKRPHREREHLVQERTRYENRILALLATQRCNWPRSARRSHPALTPWS